MQTVTVADVLRLSVPERIRLAQEIWDSVVEVPEAVAVTAEQAEEIDRRLAAYEEDPTQGSPWPDVKKRILSSL
jgi:putative addiction module component (TIGR02574 family)